MRCVFAAATRSRDTAEQSALISAVGGSLPSGEAFFIYRESNYEMEYSA